MNKIINFLKEAWLEAKKVNWPNQKEVLRKTLLVIGVSVALAIFLGGIDFLLTRILDWAMTR
jgi:preprotein translocase subunit SecE